MTDNKPTRLSFGRLAGISTAVVLVLAAVATNPVLADTDTIEFTTYADGRTNGGIRTGANNEDGFDTPGDVFVFDQFLLAGDADTVIGRNAGFCIRTDPGEPDYTGPDDPSTDLDDPTNNYGACVWTLTFGANSAYSGSSLTVAGREADISTSLVPIIGGTGQFLGASGVLASTPEPQGDDGVLFRQELMILPRDLGSDDDSDDDSDSDD